MPHHLMRFSIALVARLVFFHPLCEAAAHTATELSQRMKWLDFGWMHCANGSKLGNTFFGKQFLVHLAARRWRFCLRTHSSSKNYFFFCFRLTIWLQLTKRQTSLPPLCQNNCIVFFGAGFCLLCQYFNSKYFRFTQKLLRCYAEAEAYRWH